MIDDKKDDLKFVTLEGKGNGKTFRCIKLGYLMLCWIMLVVYVSW